MKLIESDDDFLEALNARARQLVDSASNGKLPESYASLEILTSIFSAFEGGIAKEKIAACYPVAAWREDRVEVPRALLGSVVQCWKEYVDVEASLTLGKAFGLEGGGSGKRPTKALQHKLDRDRRLSNLAIVDIISSRMEGAPISQDAAFQAVAESEGVSYETVKKAYRKHSPETLKKLKQVGVKTS